MWFVITVSFCIFKQTGCYRSRTISPSSRGVRSWSCAHGLLHHGIWHRRCGDGDDHCGYGLATRGQNLKMVRGLGGDGDKCAKCSSFCGTSSARPPTRALLLDHTGALPKFRPVPRYWDTLCVYGWVFGVGEFKYAIWIFRGAKGVAMATKFGQK